MNRKRMRKLEEDFAQRRCFIWMSPDASPEMSREMLEKLLDCPDCRSAVLAACNAEDRKDMNIDDVIRALALGDH